MAPFSVPNTTPLLLKPQSSISQQTAFHLLKRDIITTPATSQLIPLVILAAILSTTIFLITTSLLRRLWTRIIHPRLLEHYFSQSNTSTKAPSTNSTNTTLLPDAKENWARKDSNVLWSSYIDEEDLIAQFNAFAARRPSALSKKSRLFSIGSNSTVDADQSRCPLDTTPTKSSRPRAVSCGMGSGSCEGGDKEEEGEKRDIDAVEGGAKKDVSLPTSEDNPDAELRSRWKYEHETTPTKTLPVITGSGSLFRTYRASSTPDGHLPRSHQRCSHSFDAASKKAGKERY